MFFKPHIQIDLIRVMFAKICLQTRFGYVVDCVNMYRQPAFDHPLLKDHKIQVFFLVISFEIKLEAYIINN